MLGTIAQKEKIAVSEHSLIVSKTGKRFSLKILRSDYKAAVAGIMGSAATVEFKLDNHHTIRYKRDAGLVSQTIMLYVDGKQIFRKEIFNPLEGIEFPFEVEEIDCEFLYRGYAVVADVRVRIGGYQILSI